MAAGDIVVLRKPITFDKDTDDGVIPVIAAVAALPAGFDIITTEVIVGRKTKEGLSEATIVIVARNTA